MEPAPTYLVIEPLPSVRLGMMTALPRGHVVWKGEHYIEAALSDDSAVFYDWLRDSSGRIVGVELYLWKEHADSLGDLRAALNGSEESTTSIMFVPGAVGASDATQGFGDIFFYRSSTGGWLIAIDTRSWLKPGDVQRLEQISYAAQ